MNNLTNFIKKNIIKKNNYYIKKNFNNKYFLMFINFKI